MISIVAYCHSVKFAPLPLGLSDRNKMVLWQACEGRAVWNLRKNNARSVRSKKEGMLLQPLRWRCAECAIHHERDVREEQHPYIRGANKQQ